MAAAEKLDLYKKHKADYVLAKKPVLLDIAPASDLTVIGRGEPGCPDFQAKVGALYGIAYTLKFASKAAGRDYVVCKLEGLWWGKKECGDFSKEPRDTWNWKMIIRVPDFIKAADVKAATKQLIEKGKTEPFDEVKLEKIKEGKCVQMLHVGPYAAERETVGAMLAFAAEQGVSFNGIHHEIYLSDPRRVAPEKLRTILRVPVA